MVNTVGIQKIETLLYTEILRKFRTLALRARNSYQQAAMVSPREDVVSVNLNQSSNQLQYFVANECQVLGREERLFTNISRLQELFSSQWGVTDSETQYPSKKVTCLLKINKVSLCILTIGMTRRMPLNQKIDFGRGRAMFLVLGLFKSTRHTLVSILKRCGMERTLLPTLPFTTTRSSCDL